MDQNHEMVRVAPVPAYETAHVSHEPHQVAFSDPHVPRENEKAGHYRRSIDRSLVDDEGPEGREKEGETGEGE